MYDINNVFAKILTGDIPTTRLYEDEYTIAIADIHPKAPVHLLVIPKRNYVDLNDLILSADKDEIYGIWSAVQKIATQNNLIEAGYKTLINVGTGAGQEVPHLHIHILSNGK